LLFPTRWRQSCPCRCRSSCGEWPRRPCSEDFTPSSCTGKARSVPTAVLFLLVWLYFFFSFEFSLALLTKLIWLTNQTDLTSIRASSELITWFRIYKTYNTGKLRKRGKKGRRTRYVCLMGGDLKFGRHENLNLGERYDLNFSWHESLSRAGCFDF